MLCDKEYLGFDYSNDRGQKPTSFSRSEYNSYIKYLGKKES
jgi:hypothetical protein